MSVETPPRVPTLAALRTLRGVNVGAASIVTENETVYRWDGDSWRDPDEWGDDFGTGTGSSGEAISVADIDTVEARTVGQIQATYDPNNEKIGWYFQWNGLQWKKLSDRSLLHVDTYGSRPNSSATDDQDACLAAINAAVNDSVLYGTEVRFGGYAYHLREPITVLDSFTTPEANRRFGLRFCGENIKGNSPAKTQLVWHGTDDTVPVWWVAGSRCTFDRIAVYLGHATAKAYAAWLLDYTVPWQTGLSQAVFRRCFAYGGYYVGATLQSTAWLKYGFAIGSKTNPGQGSNLEDTVFDDCNVQDFLDAGFVVGGGQPYNTIIKDCDAASYRGGGITPYGTGVLLNTSAASVYVQNGNFGQNEYAFMVVGDGLLDVDGVTAERIKRLIDFTPTAGGSVSFRNSRVSVIGYDVATANLAASDKRVIRIGGSGSGGTLRVETSKIVGERQADVDTLLRSYQTESVRFDVGAGQSAEFVGCMLPNDHVFDHVELAIGESGSPRTGRIDVRQCKTLGIESAPPIPFPDRIAGSRNAGGTFTLRESLSTYRVPIAQEADATYQVHLTVQGTSGSPAAGSLRPYLTARATTYFDVAIEAAPGAGNAVTLGWEMSRPSTPSSPAASTVYYVKPLDADNQRGRYASIVDGFAGDAVNGFFACFLFKVPDLTATTPATFRGLGGCMPGATTSGWSVALNAAMTSFECSAVDGGGVRRAASVAMSAGNAEKMQLVCMSWDPAANLIRSYLNNAAGFTAACTGYTPAVAGLPTTFASWFNGGFAGGYQGYGIELYGAAIGIGVPSLANFQSFGNSVKSAFDVVDTMPGATMLHTHSVRRDRKANAPPVLQDWVGNKPLVRVDEPLSGRCYSYTYDSDPVTAPNPEESYTLQWAW